MNTTAQPINLTVLPDAQAAKSGLTLDALLSYLQFHLAPDEYGTVPRVNFDAWTKWLEDNGLDIGRKYRYITAPLTVRLAAGVYNITTIVRIFTAADIAVTGEKGATVIRFHRYDFAGEPFIWYDSFPKGRDCVAFISSYTSDTGEPGTKPVEPGIKNSLTLRDLTVRMEEGLWFPYTTVDSQGKKDEVPLGVLLSYSNFHKVELSGLDIEASGNGEVSVNVIPGDVCHNVSFERNRIFHKYIDTHQLPGNGVLDGIGTNGASPYLYSNTFVFETIKDRSNLAPGTKGAASGTGTEIMPTPVAYRGNYIRYTQKTYDQPDRTNPSSRLAYEHSCFSVYGGDTEILGNRIDGTGAVVVRHDPGDGLYGNPGNPVTLFHCFPCGVPGKYSVRISGNEAVKYGVTLSCRPQYWGNDTVVEGYCVRMENNTFSDGAAMVLYNTKNSDIAVVRNSFTGCSKETFIKAVYGVKLQSDPAVKLSFFQNKIAPGFGLGSYCNVIAADVPKDSPVLTPISEFCFMLNYLPGYAGMSMPEKNTAAQSHISDNLFESNPSNACGS